MEGAGGRIHSLKDFFHVHWLYRISFFGSSPVHTHYDVCSTLILAAILEEVLQFAMGVHICVHDHHLYLSVMKSLLYVEALKTWYVLA